MDLMQKAAKEKSWWLWFIALAMLTSAPSFASSIDVLHGENRVEIFLLEGQNRTGQQTFHSAKHVENYDPSWGVALESSVAPNSGKPPIVGPVRPYDEATKARIPGYDNHHLDPKLGRVDPDYPKGPTIGVRNDNAGGRVPGGVNLHTAKGGFQTALNDHIKKDLGFTIKQWNDLPDEVRKLHLRRYYASLGIPFPN